MNSKSMTLISVVSAILFLLLFRRLDLLLIVMPISILIGFLAMRNNNFGQRRI